MFRKVLENIKGTIEIREQERKTFRLLFLHSFLIGLASSLYFVEASRNFITKISIAEMPAAYVLSGVVGYLLMQVFKSLQKRAGVVKSFGQMLLIFSFFMILLYAGRVWLDKDIFYIKLFAYTGFVLMFAFATLFAVGFAGICLSMFNLSQSKRLLALLGTGEILASILGYLIVPVLVNVMGNTIYLLLLAAFFSLLSVWPIRLTVSGKKEPKQVTVNAAPVQKFNFAFIWKNPFILYLSLTTLFSIITVYFIDYSYLISVRYFSQLTGVAIATTVAMVFTVIKTGELFASVFSASIVASLGMRTSVLLLPALLIFGGVMAVFSVVFFNASPVFMIFFLFINKWIDRVVRKGITIPSTKIMFQINSPEERVQLQNNIDGVISQVSTIVCGLMLTALCFIVGTNDYERFLSATTLVCLVVFLVFLFMSSRLFRIYKVRIQDYLRTKHVISQADNLKVSNMGTGDTDAAIVTQLEALIKNTDLSDKVHIRALIVYYNPSADTYSHFGKDDTSGEAEFTRKITKLYFDNQNIFSRFLVIAYFLCLEPERKLRFFKDIYNVSPLRLKTYFLRELTQADFIINVSEEFYFTELTAQCIHEILWTESAINDLETTDELALNDQLRAHKEELTDALLYLLQFLNDKKSVQLISGILHKKDRNEEDLLFAGELLENTLRPSLKKLVLPVFEPISFVKRRNKMASFFYEPSLSVDERLRDIMMHDFNMVDSYTKQLALEVLCSIDPGQATVKAFTESRISNLKAIAAPVKDEVANIKERIQNNTVNHIVHWLSLDGIDMSSVMRWGIYDSQSSFTKTAKEKRGQEIENGTARVTIDSAMNTYFEIDLIGLAVLSRTART